MTNPFNNVCWLTCRECYLLLSVLGGLILLPQHSFAQLEELEVNRVTREGPMHIFPDYPDLAGLYIRSSLTNLRFESNLQIIEELGDPSVGEYILLIEPVTQTIRINAPGFLTERIPVRGLSPRQVLYYSVESLHRSSDNVIPVFVRVDPSNAVTQIDGEPVDATQSIPLEPGSHELMISLEGYRSVQEEIIVDEENTIHEYTLEELEPVGVRFITDPPGSFIAVDGTTIGQTDENGVIEQFRFPGSYSVTVSNSNYVNQQRDIVVQEEGNNEFTFTLERALASLSLAVEPEDARVEINSQPYSNISSPIELSPGVYRLQISSEGYEDYNANISIDPGDQIERNIQLEALTGSLLYSSSPSGANASLYNSEESEIESWSGIRRMDLPVGDYRLVVQQDGYETFEQHFSIEKGETVEQTVALDQLLSAESMQTGAVKESEQGQTAEQATLYLSSDVNADLFVNGEYVGQEETTIELAPGRYQVEFRHESGEESIEVELSAGETVSRTINFLEVQDSGGNAVTYSIFAPGVGHISSDKSRGYLYLAAGLGTAAFTVWSLLDQNSINKEYNDAMSSYNSASSPSAASRFRTEAMSLYNENLDAYKRTRLGVIAFSAVYAVQLIDILVSPRERSTQNFSTEGLQADLSPTGLRIRYGFN